MALGAGQASKDAQVQGDLRGEGAVVAAVDIVKGLGFYAGLNVTNVTGATGYLDTNFAGKAKAALRLLSSHDLVYVHVEAPDEAAHMGSAKAKIKAIEEEMKRTQIHKHTEHHVGLLKAKLAKLRDEAVNRALKAGGGSEGFSIRKSGDASAVLVGFPSVGKSTLLNTLTGTVVKSAPTHLPLRPLFQVPLNTEGQKFRYSTFQG
jgi:hypothetical protein